MHLSRAPLLQQTPVQGTYAIQCAVAVYSSCCVEMLLSSLSPNCRLCTEHAFMLIIMHMHAVQPFWVQLPIQDHQSANICPMSQVMKVMCGRQVLLSKSCLPIWAYEQRCCGNSLIMNPKVANELQFMHCNCPGHSRYV